MAFAVVAAISVEELHSDKDLFALLKSTTWDHPDVPLHYAENSFQGIEFAEVGPLQSLRTGQPELRRTNIQLYADDEAHARILTPGAVPDANDSRWQYLPKPVDVIPPVGEETLLDYVMNPDKAGLRHNVLDRIPKTRLRLEELLPGSSGKVWGFNIKHSGGACPYY